MSLDQRVLEASRACSGVSTEILVKNLSTLCPDFHELFAVKCLKASVGEYLQRCLRQQGARAAILCEKYTPPELQSQLLEKWLTKEDWRKIKNKFEEVFLASHGLVGSSTENKRPTLTAEVCDVNILRFDEDATTENVEEPANCTVVRHSHALGILERAMDHAQSKNSALNSNRISYIRKSASSLTGSPLPCHHTYIKGIDSFSLLGSVGTLLNESPGAILQLNDWRRFIHVLVTAAQHRPKRGSTVMLRYFRLAGSFQRGALLSETLQAIGKNVSQPKKQQRPRSLYVKFFLRCVRRCIEELPENWLGLRDDDVRTLFSLFLNNAALPYLDYFSQKDPNASWVQKWCQWPTFEYLVKDQLLRSADSRTNLPQLQNSFPKKYALSLVAYFLPMLLPSSRLVDSARLCHFENTPCSEQLSCLLSDFIKSIAQAKDIWASNQLLYSFAVRSCGHNLCSEKLWQHVRSVVALIQSLLRGDAASRNKQHPTKNENRVCWLLRLTSCLLHSGGNSEDCRSAARKQLMQLARLMDTVESTAIATCLDFFWNNVLCKYWKCVVNLVLHGLCIEQSSIKYSRFTLRHLVCISSELDGWLQIQDYFLRNEHDALKVVDGDELLKHILEFVPAMQTGKFSLRFDPSVFALLSRWSMHPVFAKKLLQASKKCCEHCLGLQGKSDSSTFFFLQLGELGIWPDFQFAKVPFAGGVHQDSEYLQVLFHFRVFVFLQLISLVKEDAEVLEGGEISEISPFFFVDACLNTFVESFRTTGKAMFTDDARLLLLCFVSLSVLLCLPAQEGLWYASAPVSQRLIDINEICQERAGVDPIFLVARFIASKKGRRFLLPIIVRGFEAELPDQRTVTFHPFAYKEGPFCETQKIEKATVSNYARLAIEKVFPKESLGSFEWPALERFLSLWICACCSETDNVPTHESITLLLRKRSVPDWFRFFNVKDRAACVARVVAVGDDYKTCQFLQSLGVDMLFLSTLCVTRWMRSTIPAKKSLRKSHFKRSVEIFVEKGIAYWDNYVGRCLIAHINSVRQSEAKLSESKAEISYSSLISLPSSLFLHLLVKPFKFLH